MSLVASVPKHTTTEEVDPKTYITQHVNFMKPTKTTEADKFHFFFFLY